MPLIDTHCHLNHQELAADAVGVIARAEAADVSKCIVVGYDVETSRLAVEQASTFRSVYAAVGLHPHDAASFGAAALAEIRSLAVHPKVVAIGEIGLDFYRDLSPREQQYSAMRAQVKLATEIELPVVFHCREAYPELLTYLGELDQVPPCVLHCFGGNREEALQAIELGFYLGFDGPITFKNADELRAIAAQTPLERILIETDAPYLAPHPYRGRQNEPAWVKLVAAKVAEVKGVTVEEVARQTWENAHRLFPRLGVAD